MIIRNETVTQVIDQRPIAFDWQRRIGELSLGPIQNSYYVMGARTGPEFALEVSPATSPRSDEKPSGDTFILRTRSADPQRYNPLRTKNLHRHFAQVEPNGQAVLAFAERYGFLGQRTFSGRTSTADNVSFEEVDYWIAQISRMKVLVRLVDLIRGTSASVDSESILGEIIEPTVTTSFAFSEASFSRRAEFLAFRDAFPTSFASMNARREWISQGTGRTELGWEKLDHEGRCKLIATAIVCEHVNLEMMRSVNPVFVPSDPPRMRLQPLNLQGAMYVLLAKSLTSSEVRQCMGCGKTFVAARTNQSYCTLACKQRAYRKRRSNAKNQGS